MTVRAIILAAGKGTRMKSDLAKVLHAVAGRSLLGWVLDAAEPLGLDRTVVVVGYQAEHVIATLPESVRAATQEEQLGTAHAAGIGLDALGDPDGTVLVLPGDMPLLSTDSLQGLLDHHAASGAAATLLTARMSDPTGYGRILRDGENIVGIVEDGDAGSTQLEIDEVNTSVYAFEAPLLEAALARVSSDNHQDEFYLTDVIEVLAAQGHPVLAVLVDEVEATGVNSHAQLARTGAVLRSRINQHWMEDGVWMLDPDQVYIDATALLEPGVRLYPGVHIEGDSAIGAGAEVGPSVHVRDSTIGSGAHVRYAVITQAVVGAGAEVGPFARLRPGAELRGRSKVGTFVEVKNSTVGEGSKVPHLSYIGDATIGEATNIGAGTITCNWDGFEKHPTTIGSRVFVGSDTMLVAPVELGDDSVTAAGSVITDDVAPGALGVERSEQKEIRGYAERRRRRAQEDQE